MTGPEEKQTAVKKRFFHKAAFFLNFPDTTEKMLIAYGRDRFSQVFFICILVMFTEKQVPLQHSIIKTQFG